MCTRFYIDVSNEEYRELTEGLDRSVLMERFRMKGPAKLVRDGEVFPTDIVGVLAPNPKGEPRIYPMRFGFRMPQDARPLLNARVESADMKPSFRDAWKSRRCAVPASCYFEWEHFRDPETGKIRTGSKYLIQPSGASLTWLLGLYRIENGLPEFVILTREPSKELSRIHDRMPLMLPEQFVRAWVRPDADPHAFMGEALTDMYIEKCSAPV